MRATKDEIKERHDSARKFLLRVLKPGKTVYTTVDSVSRSGMSRVISAYTVYKGDIINLGWYIENATHMKRAPKAYGIKMGGCGMDMGFALVYNLGRALYPKGFKLAKGQHGRNGDKSPINTDGGYALKQTWL